MEKLEIKDVLKLLSKTNRLIQIKNRESIGV